LTLLPAGLERAGYGSPGWACYGGCGSITSLPADETAVGNRFAVSGVEVGWLKLPWTLPPRQVTSRTIGQFSQADLTA
jgi:hypothetical protein